MPSKSIRVATCQFPVEGDVDRNRRAILKLIAQSAEAGAELAHFSECALSGYAGVDLPDLATFDWKRLDDATAEVQDAAKKHGLWVVLGSTHRLDERTKPHNSIYAIDPKGKIVERYDKRFCTGVAGKKPTFDLCHYSPGDRCATFVVNGVRCGMAVCFDYRFPELYREYKRLNVQAMFHSFHNARSSVVSDRKYNIWKTIVPATMQCRAAENHFWISANNSAARPSCYGSFSVQPDGAIVNKIAVHKTGFTLTDFDTTKTFFDAPAVWRDRAMKGELHSGETVDHPRSRDTTRR